MLNILDTLIVRDLVASLPPEERRLAELLMAGHDPESAARALGCAPHTVRRQMRNIRALWRAAA